MSSSRGLPGRCSMRSRRCRRRRVPGRRWKGVSALIALSQGVDAHLITRGRPAMDGLVYSREKV